MVFYIIKQLEVLYLQHLPKAEFFSIIFEISQDNCYPRLDLKEFHRRLFQRLGPRHALLGMKGASAPFIAFQLFSTRISPGSHQIRPGWPGCRHRSQLPHKRPRLQRCCPRHPAQYRSRHRRRARLPSVTTNGRPLW